MFDTILKIIEGEEMVQYILKGLSHYIYLLFNMLDFKDNGFILIIIFGMLLMCIKDKTVYKSVISVLKSIYNISKTKVGFIIVCLVSSYYMYTLIYFESKYNLIVFIFTIYLFIQDILKINLILLPESKINLTDLLKDIATPILVLFISEFVTMVEEENFNNITLVFCSLIFIPIFFIIIIVFRHFIFYEDTYNIYKKRIKIDDYEFFKIVSIISIKSKNYRITRIVLEEFLNNTYNLTYNEMKIELKGNINYIIKKYKEKSNNKIQKQKYKKNKVFKMFEFIWSANILCVIYLAIDKRFYIGSLDISYYWSISILNIYFWCDLMKNRDIENQYDFIIYMVINIILIVMIICYLIGINNTRLSERLFYIPIFIILHFKAYNKKFPNILNMPFLTENNFFGLDPNQYNKSN